MRLAVLWALAAAGAMLPAVMPHAAGAQQDDDRSWATTYYLDALAAMQKIQEPAFLTYRTSVPGGNTTISVKRDPGGLAALHIETRTSTMEPQSWSVVHRGSDGMSTITLEDGSRALTPFAIFDPTWNGVYQWVRHGLVAVEFPEMGEDDDSTQVSPAPGKTPPPLIAVVQAIGTGFYRIEDGGPAMCVDGRPGHFLRTIARSDPGTHALTGVVIDTASMRFCSMMFHEKLQTPKNKSASMTFDLALHLGDVDGYYLVRDGMLNGNARAFFVFRLPMNTIFTYDDFTFPNKIAPAAFEPRPAPGSSEKWTISPQSPEPQPSV